MVGLNFTAAIKDFWHGATALAEKAGALLYLMGIGTVIGLGLTVGIAPLFMLYLFVH